MNYLTELCRYNAWANSRILPLLGDLTAEQLRTPMEGIFGSVTDTANHLVAVERVYCEMLAGKMPDRPEEMPAAELAGSAATLGATLVALADASDGASLDVTFEVPWFKRSFTRGDGMLQLVTHSTEHRADLCSALTRLGVTTPPIDYVQYVIASGR
jgi:uncharacterized damage-inducible protein DinB